MITLLELAIKAHGGLSNWRKLEIVDFEFSVGGAFWQAKALPDGLRAAAHVEPSEKRVRIEPFPARQSKENPAMTSSSVWR